MSQQGRLIDQNLETLTGDTGGPVSPDGTSTINIIGAGTTTVSGNPGTNTLTIDTSSSGYPITPYVVGLVGEAGYQSIQAAIDVLKPAFGPHVIFVRPGFYTENLDFSGFAFSADVHIRAVALNSRSTIDGVSILGNHIPPTAGRILIENINLATTGGDIFNSSAAGTTEFILRNCGCQTTVGGYIFNLANWTNVGTITIEEHVHSASATANGIMISGAATVNIRDCYYVGNLTTDSMIINGATIILNSSIFCPITFGTGATIAANGCQFFETVTCANDSTGSFTNCFFSTGSDAAFIMSSSGNIDLSNNVIDSSNSPSITGTGAGTLTDTGIDFVDNAEMAVTLTISGGTSYSGTYKSDYTDHGVILGQGPVSDMVATSAGTDGQILIGATGADPAFANLTSTGATITITEGANTLNVEAGGTVPTTFTADAGTATPASNSLSIVGGVGGISTTAAGSTIMINVAGSALTWTEVTIVGPTGMAIDNGYIANNAGLVTLTLPDTAAIGSVVQVDGSGAGGWLIAQNAGETIHFLGQDTTPGAGGSLASSTRYDCITLRCIIADTDWVVESVVGNLTVV